ncbi:MAG TPA: S26 family signal peptidase [Brevefilum sp.]|nr:S26 family signal peptidase [Brevefilum sp.]HOR19897.1 S26 family signal peptidase [Brevefilum sp.]HPL69402.1 S26 family signal peptidase [Brevefilum sp.]
MVRLLKVRGSSLWPDFREGDYVLAADVPFPAGKIKTGDVIVFQQPGYGTLLKRVHRVLEGGQFFEVRGTQIASTDSRNFGAVPRKRVHSKVIWHIRNHSDRKN